MKDFSDFIVEKELIYMLSDVDLINEGIIKDFINSLVNKSVVKLEKLKSVAQDIKDLPNICMDTYKTFIAVFDDMFKDDKKIVKSEEVKDIIDTIFNSKDNETRIANAVKMVQDPDFETKYANLPLMAATINMAHELAKAMKDENSSKILEDAFKKIDSGAKKDAAEIAKDIKENPEDIKKEEKPDENSEGGDKKEGEIKQTTTDVINDIDDKINDNDKKKLINSISSTIYNIYQSKGKINDLNEEELEKDVESLALIIIGSLKSGNSNIDSDILNKYGINIEDINKLKNEILKK